MNLKDMNKLGRVEKVHVSFSGNLGRHLMTPRGLKSKMLEKYVGVQGIVTRIGRVYPKLIKTVHFCELTKIISSKSYNDEFDLSFTKEQQILNNNSQSQSIPLKDEHGNPLTLEFGLCLYKNH